MGRFLLDLHGEAKDLYRHSDPLCDALQVLNHIQDCQRVHIPDAGHLVPIEQPGAVNQALADFIAVIADRTNGRG